MNVLCVDQDRTKLRQMKRDTKKIVPDARIAACRDPSRAERLTREKGCDVLLTNTVFDGSNWDGMILARKIQSVCPRANIIFIANRADKPRHTTHGRSEPARFSCDLTRSSGWQRHWQTRALHRYEEFYMKQK